MYSFYFKFTPTEEYEVDDTFEYTIEATAKSSSDLSKDKGSWDDTTT